MLKKLIQFGCKTKCDVKKVLKMNLETIIDLFLCHNHKLVPNMVQYMPCHNKIPLHLKRPISINDEAGIPQCSICYGSSRWCW